MPQSAAIDENTADPTHDLLATDRTRKLLAEIINAKNVFEAPSSKVFFQQLTDRPILISVAEYEVQNKYANEHILGTQPKYIDVLRLQNELQIAKEKIEELEAEIRLRDSQKRLVTPNSVKQATESVVIESALFDAAAGQSTTGDAMARSGFLANDSWIHALTAREQKLLEPKVMEAVGKLLKLKGIVTYPKERGRAAKGPHTWIKETLVAPLGPLTLSELNLIPKWVFRRFDERLYIALHNVKRQS